MSGLFQPSYLIITVLQLALFLSAFYAVISWARRLLRAVARAATALEKLASKS